ncbi:MAG: hypothetical protein WBP93_18775 [Pyrinomonadaceae bacterium]
MYKPNFCAECGNRIERLRWRLWTSRKFCPSCVRRFRKARILFPLIGAATLFSLGLATGRAVRPTAPPLTISRNQINALAPVSPVKAAAQNGSNAVQTQTQGSEQSYGPDGTLTERPTDPNEVVSICGARTKKGTPCQRRVRGTGRCWQHKGMPAIIPTEKRIVAEN